MKPLAWLLALVLVFLLAVPLAISLGIAAVTTPVLASDACLGLSMQATSMEVASPGVPTTAHVAAGRGWLWPHPSELFAGVPAVLAGAATTDPIGVRAWVVAVELLLVGVLSWAAAASWRRWGPSRLKGVATRDQAEEVLGVSRLRRVAPVVRPDLHRPRRPRGGQR